MHRVYNFSAGPAALPEAVLKRAQSELLDYQGLGMSVMEISHRGKVFTELAENTEAVLRKLLGVPDDYAVLFTHGGATAQFSAVPLNLTRPGQSAAYVHTGSWSRQSHRRSPALLRCASNRLHRKRSSSLACPSSKPGLTAWIPAMYTSA